MAAPLVELSSWAARLSSKVSFRLSGQTPVRAKLLSWMGTVVAWEGVVAAAVITGLGKLENGVYGVSGRGVKSDSAEFERIVAPGVNISDLNF